MRTMRLVVVGAVALLGGLAFAKVPQGESLILNGTFEAGDALEPPFWEGVLRNAGLLSSGGPEGRGAVRIAARQGRELKFRQRGLVTAPNGRYVLKFKYRLNGAKFKRFGAALIVGAWTDADNCLVRPDGKPGEWIACEKTLVAKVSPKDNSHALVFFAQGLVSGSVDVADVSLSPADKETADKTETSSLVGFEKKLRLVPISPRLDEVSDKDRTIAFKFFGEIPAGANDVAAEFDFGAAGKQSAAPAAGKSLRVVIPKGAKGNALVARIVADGETLFERTYRYAFGVKPTLPDIGKRLNNLCTEIVNTRMKSGRTVVKFGCDRRAWYFVDAGSAQVTADGQRVVRYVELPAGDHELAFDCAAECPAVVRRISEVFHYATGTFSPLTEQPAYGWEFCEKYVNPWITTQSSPDFSPRRVKTLQARGQRIVSNMMSTSLTRPTELTERMRRNTVFQGGLKLYGGVSMDEQYLNNGHVMNNFADGLWAFEDRPGAGHFLYSWFCGRPTIPGCGEDALSAAVNALDGRAKILFENYTKTVPGGEKAAAKSFRDEMAETLSAYERSLPGISGRFGVMLGNFNQTGFISVWHHPEVDLKYYLDQQMNILANDPAFKDLSLVGYWCGKYSDEELYRWSFMLLRHYVFEGKRTMLSDEYGVRYRGLVENGDFADGLNGWTATDAVKTAMFDSLGLIVEGRWYAPKGVGDTAAVFPAKSSSRTHSVAQVLKGLVPGRTYRLVLCSFNVKQVERNQAVASDHGIVVDLGDGAEVDELRSWVNAGPPHYYSRDANAPRANVHNWLFKAKGSETRLVISNADTKPGDSIGVNFVSVTPYVPAE